MNQTLPTQTRSARVRAWLASAGRLLLDIHRPPFYFALAAIMTFVIECLSRHSVIEAVVFLFTNPLAYLANYGIVLLTLLPALLIPKRLAGVVLMWSIWTALGIAQFTILCTRVSPLSAADLTVVMSVFSIITSYLSIPVIILIVAAILGLFASLTVLFIKSKVYPIRWRQFGITFISALAGTALVILLGFGTGNLTDRFPNLVNAYNAYGFPYCFCVSIVDQGVDRPDGYDEDMINGILGTLPEEEEPAPPEEDRAPNVILVQLESFFDVNYIQDVTYSADPTQNFTALKAQYPSGILTVPVIGAGTVNTEFEVLTGISTADFGAGEYPFRSIMLKETCESIAYDLLESGYRTHAIHNHEGSFYQRNEVYRNLGFESFTSIEYFEDPTFNITGWAHDTLLTDEILYLMNQTEESDFVFAVSVQGHGQYPDDYVPTEEDVLVTSGMEDPTVRSHYEFYINQLREMDVFIGELTAAVMAMEEDTVLVFYGDHLPTIALDEGITLETDLLETEYIIISNYETPHRPTDNEKLTTYQLFPVIMETIDNNTGVMNRFHRTYRHSESYLPFLTALAYDSLYGDRIAYDGVAYPTIEDMAMGSRPITITGYEIDGEYLYIKGENFTAYCYVTLDGRKQDTEFVDKNTLRVESKEPTALLERTDEITIRVISDINKLLSETEPFSVH